MITLNNINLSSIDLSGIDLRGIKLGLGGRDGGSGDGFPQLPGDVTRWHFGGLTNEMMAAMDDPRLEDADGKGRFLSFKNFAWSGMSGVGGYVDNWNSSADWNINNYWVNSHTDHKLQFITASTVVQARSNNIYNAENVYKNILNVNGLTEAVNKGSVGGLRIRATDPITSKAIKTFSFETDGVIQISFDDVLQDYYVDYLLYGSDTKDIDITIEQLPLYPGALVFDGVDDYGTCDNFPVLTKEKGYTVVALRSYLAESIGYLVYNGTNAKQSAFAFERSDSLDTWSWGKNSSIRNSLPKLMSYQTSNSYNNNIISTGTAIEGDKLIRIASSGGYCNVAIWELVFLDHDATEEELTKIKDYFIKTYPWLFPDQAWTVTGKTNEDEDRATIANITGNGNDLVLSNFGFAEGSGYNEEGEYAGYLVTDGVDDKVQSSSFTMNEDWTIVGDWELLSNVQINCGIVKSQNVYLYNTANGLLISINNPRSLQSFGTKSLHAICSDGRLYDRNWVEYEYTADQNFEIVKSSLNIGFNLNNYTQIAFKNLGIYNNQLLSKDDCIKAYNYLQTLKAK